MALWNQVVKFHKETGSEEKKFISKFLLYPLFHLQDFLDPFMGQTKISPILEFMVLKMTGWNSGFQPKNGF